MNAIAARRWLVTASLLTTGSVFVFLLLAPVVGYPLRWDQAFRIVEIVIPVFLGYLGTASQFVFKSMTGAANEGVVDHAANPLLSLLVKGPLVVFGVTSLALLVSYGLSNSADAVPGSGMTIDTLAAGFTAALGLLAVTTHVAVSYLFSLQKEPVTTLAPTGPQQTSG